MSSFSSCATGLAPDFGGQEKRFARAFSIVKDAIRARVFPAASLAVTFQGRLVAWKGFGHFTYGSGSPSVAPTTIFDLASVTKVVATTAMAMILFERGQLKLDAPIVQLLPGFADAHDPRRTDVTVGMLLAHSSGLPSWYKLYEHAKTRRELVAAALHTPLEAPPLARSEYSDIGFILLGEILAKITGDSIDEFCHHEIFAPLGMSAARFNPPPEWRLQIPPTLNDGDFRHRIIQGEVNDENASVMGGVAGHAGLFASAFDLAIFAHFILSGGLPILKPETLAVFTRRESTPSGTSRALGWDTPSNPSQSGRYFSSKSFGHLGHTGTSLWCDPERCLSITLLTNRTWPDRSCQEIKRVRPLVHDAIGEALSGERA